MSKASKITDAERTATMLDLLKRAYEGDQPERRLRAYVVVEEVAPGTGFSAAQRWADVLALSVWPSNGLTLDGYEIKASRADLKKELADPSKHRAVARYCDTWTLLAWDESVLCDGIPDDWGIELTRDDAHGCREFYAHRKAPKRTPDPWPREFVCSLVRNAYEQSPGADYVARAVVAAHGFASRENERTREYEQANLVAPLARIIYGENSYRWPDDAKDARKIIKVAAERLTQLPLGQQEKTA